MTIANGSLACAGQHIGNLLLSVYLWLDQITFDSHSLTADRHKCVSWITDLVKDYKGKHDNKMSENDRNSQCQVIYIKRYLGLNPWIHSPSWPTKAQLDARMKYGRTLLRQDAIIYIYWTKKVRDHEFHSKVSSQIWHGNDVNDAYFGHHLSKTWHSYLKQQLSWAVLSMTTP